MSTNIYLQRFQYLVYIHTCTVTGKSYIGYTSSSINERFSRHLYSAKSGSIYAFHSALRKHGKENFVSNVLYLCNSKEEAGRAETELIEIYGTYKNGYNETRGGAGGGSQLHPIQIGNTIYPSMRAAIRILKMDSSTIKEYLKCPSGDILEYALTKRIIRPVTIDNIKYRSLRQAAKILNIPVDRVRKYIDNNLSLSYNNIHDYILISKKSKGTKPIVVNDVRYSSMKIACEELGVTYKQLYKIIS